jgi:hypothetical protein
MAILPLLLARSPAAFRAGSSRAAELRACLFGAFGTVAKMPTNRAAFSSGLNFLLWLSK